MDKSTPTQRAHNLRKNSTAWLTEQGFKVLRFWNHEVFQQLPSILEVVMKASHS
jgi:very-short-patch-repair endonuclease